MKKKLNTKSLTFIRFSFACTANRAIGKLCDRLQNIKVGSFRLFSHSAQMHSVFTLKCSTLTHYFNRWWRSLHFCVIEATELSQINGFVTACIYLLVSLFAYDNGKLSIALCRFMFFPRVCFCFYMERWA